MVQHRQYSIRDIAAVFARCPLTLSSRGPRGPLEQCRGRRIETKALQPTAFRQQCDFEWRSRSPSVHSKNSITATNSGRTHTYLPSSRHPKSSPHLARKLVRRPQDWPWSSYLFYEKGDAGLITIDPV